MSNDNIDLYGVLAGNVVELNFGHSIITGNLGSFNTVIGSGTVHVTNNTNTGSTINNALTNASTFYTQIINATPDTTTGSSNIAGMTFNPGINALTNSGVTISGSTPQVTLDGNGTYYFQIPNSDLVTDSTSGQVFFNLMNGAQSSQVYWVVSGNVNL